MGTGWTLRCTASPSCGFYGSKQALGEAQDPLFPSEDDIPPPLCCRPLPQSSPQSWRSCWSSRPSRCVCCEAIVGWWLEGAVTGEMPSPDLDPPAAARPCLILPLLSPHFPPPYQRSRSLWRRFRTLLLAYGIAYRYFVVQKNEEEKEKGRKQVSITGNPLSPPHAVQWLHVRSARGRALPPPIR